MTGSEAIQLLQVAGAECKKLGVRRFRVGVFEIEFGAGAPVDPATVKEFQDAFDKGMPTAEEVLFYSAPGGTPEKEEP